MNSEELQEKLKSILGWRVGPQTAAYIQSRMQAGSPQEAFPILAHDARTGHAIRPSFDPRRLNVPSTPKPAATAVGQMLLFPAD